MTLLLAASLWFVHPAPRDMPRAEAYFVKEGESMRLEDRYEEADLWEARAALGWWEDDDGRVFAIARADTLPPKFSDGTKTRLQYDRSRVPVDPKDPEQRDFALSKLVPFEMPEKPASPRQEIRGMRDVLYLHGTNVSAIACAFLPEKTRTWYVAVWSLLPGDDFAAALQEFEEGILRRWDEVVTEQLPSEAGEAAEDAGRRKEAERAELRARRKETDAAAERRLLREAAHHSVTNYAGWHATDGEEFVVLDDLPAVHRFVPKLTNDLSVMRRKYAEMFPSPIDGSNVLCVARIFKDRDEYLDAAGEDMKWTAAYWSPQRRELVAYLPEDGSVKLLETIRHEAFHQYLSYACSMVSASPWINEGYAQYFEGGPDGPKSFDGDGLVQYAEQLPAVLSMDYAEFYDGTSEQRALKYRIALSIAVFLERGAPKVRFEPYKNLKADYVKALVKTKNMREATVSALGGSDGIAKFVADWKRYWEKQ